MDPEPLRQPVQAEARLSWLASADNLFQNPSRARVFFAVRRAETNGSGDVALHLKDQEIGRYVPHVPTAATVSGGRIGIYDRAIPRYDNYQWRVSGMDIWGRFSPFATVSAQVVDQVPPPAPTRLEAELRGNAAAPQWDALQLGFDWTAAQAELAPDLVRFEIHVRQGRVPFADSDKPATWGVLEHTAGATMSPLRIDWPGGTPAPPGGGLTVTTAVSVVPVEDDGGHHLSVQLGPIQRAFSSAGLAEMSVTVTALDATGNMSPFAAMAVATRVDRSTPPAPALPDDLAQSSYPDARGRAFYRIDLSIPARASAQIMRTSARALLTAGGTDDATFEALSRNDQVVHVKTLATTHPEVFAADHETPHASTASSHAIELNGNDRGWTVATVRLISQTQVRAPWPTDPTRFVVIAVPKITLPELPGVEEVLPGDRQVTLRIAPDPSAAATAFQIYRTRDPVAAADVRTMRPVATASATDQTQVVIDDGLFADIDYFYRVVAIGEQGVRSPPTQPLLARPYSTQPPEPPELLEVLRPSSDPSKRQVTWTLPRRDYTVTLYRRTRGFGYWGFADAVGEDGALDLGTLTATLENGHYRYSIGDSVPDPDALYTYRLRITDPRGRSADSFAVEESP